MNIHFSHYWQSMSVTKFCADRESLETCSGEHMKQCSGFYQSIQVADWGFLIRCAHAQHITSILQKASHKQDNHAPTSSCSLLVLFYFIFYIYCTYIFYYMSCMFSVVFFLLQQPCGSLCYWDWHSSAFLLAFCCWEWEPWPTSMT